MATLTRAYSEIDDDIAYASSVNRIWDDLYSTINALNSANIISSGIDSININACAITTLKIANSGVETINLNNQGVTYIKIDHDYSILINEVF